MESPGRIAAGSGRSRSIRPMAPPGVSRPRCLSGTSCSMHGRGRSTIGNFPMHPFLRSRPRTPHLLHTAVLLRYCNTTLYHLVFMFALQLRCCQLSSDILRLHVPLNMSFPGFWASLMAGRQYIDYLPDPASEYNTLYFPSLDLHSASSSRYLLVTIFPQTVAIAVHHVVPSLLVRPFSPSLPSGSSSGSIRDPSGRSLQSHVCIQQDEGRRCERSLPARLGWVLQVCVPARLPTASLQWLRGRSVSYL